jgi:hypothetical protein
VLADFSNYARDNRTLLQFIEGGLREQLLHDGTHNANNRQTGTLLQRHQPTGGGAAVKRCLGLTVELTEGSTGASRRRRLDQ